MPNKYRTPSFDIIQELQTQIKALRQRVQQLENAKTTTGPIYNKGTIGTRDMVPGQLFIGTDNTINYVNANGTVYEVHGTIF